MKLPNRRSLVLFIGLLLLSSVVCQLGAPSTAPPPANNFVTSTPGGSTIDATDTPTTAAPDAPTPLVPVHQTFTPAPPPINTVEPIQAKINGPTRGQVGEILTFNADGSTGPISVYNWDFGDGSSDTGKTTVSHTYQTPGVYTVKVTAQGAGSTSTASLTLSIDPAQEALRAVINGPTSGQVGQPLNFNSFNSTGPIIGVSWDFGDGTGAGNNSQVSHTYNASGTYRVTLTVLSQNSTANTTMDVVINRPPERVRAVINGPTYGRVGEPLTFNSFGSSGPIAMVSWRFGDGTGAGDQIAVTHRYGAPGVYEVVLLVQGESIDSGNDSTSMMVRIDPAPEQVRAVITGPDFGRVGENLTFHAFNSTGPIANISWNFGDGSVAGDERSVTHSFFAPGTYQVTLRVQGENPGSGSDSAILVVRIDPLAEPVRAVINGPTYGRVGENLTFDSFGSTGPIAAVSWNFGDGSVAGDQASIIHNFFTPGTYRVTLNVQGESPGSGSDSASLMVTIDPAVETVRAVISGPSEGRVNEPLTFDSFGSTGPIAAVSWVISDGTIAGDEASVTHSFLAPGTYQVRLNVQGENAGSGSDSDVISVTIQP